MRTTFLSSRIGAEGSYSRLERLIFQRLEPNADKEEIDAQIWDLFGEEWAVLFTDLSGFSRRVAEFGIIHFLQTIVESERLFLPLIDAHGGILLKVEGDSTLIIFRTAKRALRCAIAMQQACHVYNQSRIETEKVLLCAGIGFGQMLRIGDTDVYGAEVNAASKLGEDIATLHEVLVTEAVKQSIGDDPSLNVSFDPIDAVPPGANAAYRVIYSQ